MDEFTDFSAAGAAPPRPALAAPFDAPSIFDGPPPSLFPESAKLARMPVEIHVPMVRI